MEKQSFQESLDINEVEFLDLLTRTNKEYNRIDNAHRALYPICIGIKPGDIALCPDGFGNYAFGVMVGDYFFEHENDAVLPHRRKVEWDDRVIRASRMSVKLIKKLQQPQTLVGIKECKEYQSIYLEIENLINDSPALVNKFSGEVARYEKHISDFLLENWHTTPLAKAYDLIPKHDEAQVLTGSAREYKINVGSIDLLAVDKKQKEYLVIEIKKTGSYETVGQILSYMGCLKNLFVRNAWRDRSVRACIITYGISDSILCALEELYSRGKNQGGLLDIDYYHYVATYGERDDLAQDNGVNKLASLRLCKVPLEKILQLPST